MITRFRHCVVGWLWIITCTLAFLPERRRYPQRIEPSSQGSNPPLSRPWPTTNGNRLGLSSSSLSSSYNPNDYETPEERAARMEMVRKIQATFYRDESSLSSSESQNHFEDQWNRFDEVDPSLLYNLPLWRVQWTELPGYQNVLNVHVPHYTHMFRKLLAQHTPISTSSSSLSSSPTSSVVQRRPVYFGHVYLPGGSEKLGDIEYNLPEDLNSSSSSSASSLSSSTYEGSTTTKKNQNKATLIGTLMKITDYYENEEDGRLTLVVQGVAPIRILAASQQVPYAIASRVQILSDDEPWETTVMRGVQEQKFDDDENVAGSDVEPEGAVVLSEADPVFKNAIRAMLAKQADLLRPLEYWSTTLSPTGDRTMMKAREVPVVSPLSNVNGSVTLEFPTIVEQCQETFRAVMASITTTDTNTKDVGQDGLPTTTQAMNDRLLYFPNSTDPFLSPIYRQEQQVWIELDRMLQLLGQLQPGISIPVPSQLMGLLPTFVDWPSGFRLEEYANRLEQFNTTVGTYSQSPFVRLSKMYPEYPPYRRASRLSYSIWLLLESIAIGNQGVLDRQRLLERSRIGDRLELAIQQLQTVNDVLQQLSLNDNS